MAPIPKPSPATVARSEESTPPRPVFPIAALGPRLSQAILAVAHRTQAPVELVAHDVLTLAALAAQRLVSLRLPTGADRPVSCFFGSMVGAQDGRSAVEKMVVDAARLWERTFEDEFPMRVAAHVKEGVASGVQRPKPAHRLDLFYDARNPEADDRYRSFTRQAAFFAHHLHDLVQPGHYRRGEVASLCGIWNGTVKKRADGPALFPRLCLHLVVTPRTGGAFLADAELAESGLLDRMLCAVPASRLGARLFAQADDDAPPEEFERLLDYLGELFEQPATPDTRIVGFSKDGSAAWLSFARETEKAIAPGGAFAPIPGFASLLAEHAARLAAIIGFMNDCTLAEIHGSHLQQGIALARFYAEERLCQQKRAAPELSTQEKEEILRDWLQRTQAEKEVTLRDVCRTGPRTVRDVDTAYRLMRRMERLGVVQPANAAFQGASAPRRQRAQYAWRVEKATGQGVA